MHLCVFLGTSERQPAAVNVVVDVGSTDVMTSELYDGGITAGPCFVCLL